jgi:hypothetical protein
MARYTAAVLLVLLASVGAVSASLAGQAAPDNSSNAPAIKLHPAALADLINSVGGQQVTLPAARVIAVVNPRALLVESIASLAPVRGRLSRVLILVHGGALNVDADTIAGADVRVTGIARTLVGVQVTREVPWPPELRPDLVRRLEIGAAVVATSVQTTDGVDVVTRSVPE